jgi:hypothetical protein
MRASDLRAEFEASNSERGNDDYIAWLEWRVLQQIDRDKAAHAYLDDLGVARGYTPQQKLTVLGRLIWLRDNVSGFTAFLEQALKQSSDKKAEATPKVTP